MNTQEYKTFVGIDVSRDGLDGAVRPAGWTFHVRNTAEGYQELITRLPTDAPVLVVVEGSGGYEQGVVEALQEAGVAVSIVNAARVKNFLRSTGRLAKTDAIDAAGLAQFAEVVRPPRSQQTGTQRALRGYLQRRDGLSTMLKAERQRRQRATDPLMQASLDRIIETLLAEQKTIDRIIADRLRSDAACHHRAEVLRREPGVGPVVSTTLIAQCPELGQVNRREIASLVGLAPWARDSGQYHGRRQIYGGRQRIRDLLYVATMTATRVPGWLHDHYHSLLAQGKRKKVALVACARRLLVRLNAKLRDALQAETALLEPKKG